MQYAIVLVLALAAVASANPGVLAPAVYSVPAPALLAHPAPLAVAHPVAVPVATSHSYKVRAPAAKILTAGPVLHAAPAPVLLG